MGSTGPSEAPLGEAPDAAKEEAVASAAPPEPESRSTAAIEPVERSDESDSEELDDWEWLRQNDIFSESNFMPPRDSAQPD